MLRELVTAAVVAGAVAFAAPPAAAAHAQHACDFVAESEDGLNYQGHAYGYVVSPLPEEVSLECELVVGGSVVWSAEVRGAAFVTVDDPVSFTANEFTDIRLCYSWTAGAERDGDCPGVSITMFPAQEFKELIAGLLGLVSSEARNLRESVLCPVLRMLTPGVPGVVDIAGDGDVTVAGQVLVQCWPSDYEEPPPEIRERWVYTTLMDTPNP